MFVTGSENQHDEEKNRNFIANVCFFPKNKQLVEGVAATSNKLAAELFFHRH